jgi:hypothetical protein
MVLLQLLPEYQAKAFVLSFLPQVVPGIERAQEYGQQKKYVW